MKTKLLALALGLLLTMPFMLQAEEAEITLVEVVEMDNLDGDGPLDSSGEMGSVPPSPNDFRAIINGHVLSVAAPNGPLQSRLIVNKVDGTPVVNFPFRRTATVNLADTGEYTLTIKTGNRTFEGNFSVTD